MKNAPPIVKLNKNVIKLSNILMELDKKVSQLTADVESINSYIKQQKLKDKETLEQTKEEIKYGWWFS